MLRPLRVSTITLLTLLISLNAVWNLLFPDPLSLFHSLSLRITGIVLAGGTAISSVLIYYKNASARFVFLGFLVADLLFYGYAAEMALLTVTFLTATFSGSAFYALFSGHAAHFFSLSVGDWEKHYRPKYEKRMFLRSNHGIFAKSISLFFLGPATFGFFTALVLLGNGSVSEITTLPTVFVVFLSTVFGLIPGTYLWGNSRWKRITGVVLLLSGTASFAVWTPFLVPAGTSALVDFLAGVFPRDFSVFYGLLLPLVWVAVGAALFYGQTVADREAWARELKERQPPAAGTTSVSG